MGEKSLNRVSLIGRVGADPQINSFEDGRRWAALSVATNDQFKDKAGEWQSRAYWHRVIVRNQFLVDICAKYVSKGIRVYVEGALQTRKYTAANGNPAMITEVVISAIGHELIVLSPPKAGGDDYESTGGGLYDRVSSTHENDEFGAK